MECQLLSLNRLCRTFEMSTPPGSGRCEMLITACNQAGCMIVSITALKCAACWILIYLQIGKCCGCGLTHANVAGMRRPRSCPLRWSVLFGRTSAKLRNGKVGQWTVGRGVMQHMRVGRQGSGRVCWTTLQGVLQMRAQGNRRKATPLWRALCD